MYDIPQTPYLRVDNKSIHWKGCQNPAVVLLYEEVPYFSQSQRSILISLHLGIFPTGTLNPGDISIPNVETIP